MKRKRSNDSPATNFPTRNYYNESHHHDDYHNSNNFFATDKNNNNSDISNTFNHLLHILRNVQSYGQKTTLPPIPPSAIIITQLLKKPGMLQYLTSTSLRDGIIEENIAQISNISLAQFLSILTQEGIGSSSSSSFSQEKENVTVIHQTPSTKERKSSSSYGGRRRNVQSVIRFVMRVLERRYSFDEEFMTSIVTSSKEEEEEENVLHRWNEWNKLMIQMDNKKEKTKEEEDKTTINESIKLLLLQETNLPFRGIGEDWVICTTLMMAYTALHERLEYVTTKNSPSSSTTTAAVPVAPDVDMMGDERTHEDKLPHPSIKNIRALTNDGIIMDSLHLILIARIISYKSRIKATDTTDQDSSSFRSPSDNENKNDNHSSCILEKCFQSQLMEVDSLVMMMFEAQIGQNQEQQEEEQKEQEGNKRSKTRISLKKDEIVLNYKHDKFKIKNICKEIDDDISHITTTKNNLIISLEEVVKSNHQHSFQQEYENLQYQKHLAFQTQRSVDDSDDDDDDDSQESENLYSMTTTKKKKEEQPNMDTYEQTAAALRSSIIQLHNTTSAEVTTLSDEIIELVQKVGSDFGMNGIITIGSMLTNASTNDNNATGDDEEEEEIQKDDQVAIPILSDAILANLCKGCIMEQTSAVRASAFIKSFVLPHIHILNNSKSRPPSRLLTSTISNLVRDRPMESVKSLFLPALCENTTYNKESAVMVPVPPSKAQCEFISRIFKSTKVPKESMSHFISQLVSPIITHGNDDDDESKKAEINMIIWSEHSVPVLNTCLQKKPPLTEGTVTALAKLIDELSRKAEYCKNVKFSTLFQTFVTKFTAQLKKDSDSVSILRDASSHLKTFSKKSIISSLKKL